MNKNFPKGENLNANLTSESLSWFLSYWFLEKEGHQWAFQTEIIKIFIFISNQEIIER